MPEPTARAPDLDRGPAAAPEPVRRLGKVQGRRVVWHEAGAAGAPTLLLLHGGGTDEALISWPHVLRAFPERRVVAPDLPGYGGTARLRGPYRIEALARWVMAFMDEAEVVPGAVAGVSMGGATAITLALEAPERVRALVAVAAFGLGGHAPMPLTVWLAARMPITPLVYAAIAADERTARRVLSRVFADPERIPPDMLAAVRVAARRQVLARSFGAFLRGETRLKGFRTDLSTRLPEIGCPTLFVHGTGDALVPAQASRRAAGLVPGAKLALLDAGHNPMREAPEAFLAALRGFLDGLD